MDIRILHSNNIQEESYGILSEDLSRISASEPAMLERSSQFYREALESNRLVVAINWAVSNIVGSGLLLPLSKGWAEVSGIYVHKDYRGNKIWEKVLGAIKELGKIHNVNLLLTMKPSIHWSEGMIVEASKNDFHPVSFEFLKKYPDTYKNCCVCYDNDGSKNCKDRDSICVLWIEGNIDWASKAWDEFIISGQFNSAITSNVVREKVLTYLKKSNGNNQ